MIGGLSLSFGAPLVLFGLLALPVIWWLLKLTPPRPQTEVFPPLRILQRVLKVEETPAKSPWWLTLLRLLLAALIILALAAPILNPSDERLSGDGPLAVLVDNGWASAGDWEAREAAAADLINQAGEAGRPVALAFSAEGPANDATPVEAATALERLAAARPRPVPTDRAAAAQRLATALDGNAPGTLAFLSDGLDGVGEPEAAIGALAPLAALGQSQALLYRPSIDGLAGITNASNATDALSVSAVRPEGSVGSVTYQLRALDAQGREVGRAPLVFNQGSASAEARFAIPPELRNDIARLEVENEANAAAVRLVDDSFRRRRVGLLSGEAADLAQPLLSPLYYISRALEPFADLARPTDADLSRGVPELIAQRPSMIVLADIGVLPEAARTELTRWVEGGGTLVRFAGPRLAASTGEDPLVPVRLRGGERQLGGALSWSEPQAIAPMTPTSPFAGITVPDDVTVTRQILAEPSVDLTERTWASLTDGTPLVTAGPLGSGQIVLFHTTAEATWSNLPISGAFVDMLRRIVTLSRAAGPAPAAGAEPGEAVTLAPYRMLDANGILTSPDPEVEPLQLGPGGPPLVSPAHPPGLYGSEEGYVALNLLSPGTVLRPLPADLNLGAPVAARGYGADASRNLTPWLFAGALLLFALDALALLWMNGVFSRLGRMAGGRRAASAAVLLAVLTGGTLFSTGGHAVAQEPGAQPQPERRGPRPADPNELGIDVAAAIEATETTHFAYVETGESDVDEVSRQGLDGLTQFVAAKTALEPGAPVGVDISEDELSFYPLIYWPIRATAPMPDNAAISRIDAYMKQGGTVLFDVDEGALGGLNGGAVSDGQRRLRDILADLDIPPLEPVPVDHVLTKAFYIMDDFPGRHEGSDLWVESLVRDPNAAERPANAGDGVSSIMITSNDFASAWAVDAAGMFVYPTDSSDPVQREHAYRAGVNIAMYVLTGNYKADQVHVPALLERLGQ